MLWLESLYKDARFEVRILAKERGITAAAVLSLSLAIGACTAAFSLIDALMLRPLRLLTEVGPRPKSQINRGVQRQDRW